VSSPRDLFILSPFFLDQALDELFGIAEPDWEILEPELAGEDAFARLSAIHSLLAKSVEKTIRSGNRPVSIAGDCCTSIGVLAGLQKANLRPRLIWLDAHGDFNTWETSPSGFIGGMPLAMVVGRGDQRLLEQVGLEPLEESQVILFDARDLDPAEEEALTDSEVRHFTSTVEFLDNPVPRSPVYVHLDTDVVSAAEMPGQNYPAPGGPGLAEALTVMQSLSSRCQIVAVSMSTWNPGFQGAETSRRASRRLLRALLADQD
jgi:arginase